MKKQITILFLFIISIPSQSQKTITTTAPCTDVMAQEAKGRWIKIADVGSYNTKETSSRIDQIHDLLLKIYPQATGVDAAWHRTAGISYFAAKRKYNQTSDDRLTFDYQHLPHFTYYYYNSGFFRYWCEYGKTNSMVPGYPGETGTWLNIIANDKLGDLASDDSWTINGLPVLMHKPPITSKDGVEFSHPEEGQNVYHVLIHRKGMLPYIPVTRKQYLDYCIIYHTKLHNEIIKNFEQIPVRSLEEQEKEKKAKLDKFQKQFGNDPKKLKVNVDFYLSSYKTDQQIRDDRVTAAKKNKDDELKKFTDELEKTTSEGFLDFPAMVLVKYFSSPVFETDPAKGLTLVTENPEYIRKDLPKYVPQFFIVSLTWDDLEPQKRFAEIFKQNFSFEKLQAMIDK